MQEETVVENPEIVSPSSENVEKIMPYDTLGKGEILVERYIPKPRVEITSRNFLKRYKVDKKIKQLKDIYWPRIEEHYKDGISTERKRGIMKLMIYDLIVNKKMPGEIQA